MCVFNRDDGLGVFRNLSCPEVERKKKESLKFLDFGLSITTKTNLKVVDFRINLT